jgi:hypothetical protein
MASIICKKWLFDGNIDCLDKMSVLIPHQIGKIVAKIMGN